MANKRSLYLEQINENVDNIFLNIIIEISEIDKTYQKSICLSKSNLEKSFFLIGILASINSLYEKFIKKLLKEYLNMLKVSKKSFKKEFKNILSVKYNKGKELKNLSCEDMDKLSSILKEDNLFNNIETNHLLNEYKSFNNIDDIFYLIVNHSLDFFKKENESELKDFLKNILNSYFSDDQIKKLLTTFDFNLIYKIEQVKEQLKLIYKKDRTFIIHGDYRKFEDISISKPGTTELLSRNSFIWFCVVYISLKKLIKKTY